MAKFQIGKEYIVKMRDQRSVEVLREWTLREKFIYNIGSYMLITLRVLAVIGSLVFPPLLLFTLPLLRKNNDITR